MWGCRRIVFTGKHVITQTDCPFCGIAQDRVLLGNEVAVALRDTFPLTSGHTLVVPRTHVRSLYELPPEAQADVWELVRAVRQRLFESGVEAFNIGVNDGAAAGQTIDHAHIHIIPRRAGDCPDPRGGIRLILPTKARYWE